MGSIYFSNPFSEHSFGSYFAGYAADAQPVQLSHDDNGKTIQVPFEKLSENPSEDDMVADFAGRQRATFSDPRAVRKCQEQDVCELLKDMVGNPAFAGKDLQKAIAKAEKCLTNAFSALDALDAIPADKLTEQLTELEDAAAQGRVCKNNPLDKALVKCSNAAAALADLYNTPGFISQADDGLLDSLDALQERLSTTPTELCRVIENSSQAGNLGGKTLSEVLAPQGSVAAPADTQNVKDFMTAIAAVGTKIDSFAKDLDSLVGKTDTLTGQPADLSPAEVQTAAEAIKARAVAASQKLTACTSLSGELKSAFKEKLDGLVARLDARNQAIADQTGKSDSAASYERNLRSSGMLLRLLQDDQFSATWYATALEKGIPEEIIDMRYAPDKMITPEDAPKAEEAKQLGKGVFNTVYAEKFSGKGSVHGEHEMVGKNLALDQKGIQGRSAKSSVTLLGLIPENLLVNNFSAWKTSQKLTGSCPIVSCTVGESSKGLHGDEDKLTMFMDKAPGRSVRDGKFGDYSSYFSNPNQPLETKLQIVGQIFEQASDLDFSDWISGQSDRHLGNVMIDLSLGKKPVVTLRGIDNDLSFMSNRVGLNRFRIPAEKFGDLIEGWNTRQVYDDKNSSRMLWPYRNLPDDCATNPKFSSWIKKVTVGGKQYVELDAEKAPLEYEGGFLSTFGLNSCRKPTYVSLKTYNRIMAAAKELHELKDSDNKVARQHEILGISPKVDGEAFDAVLSRFEEVVAHLQLLKEQKCVYSDSDFTDFSKLAEIHRKSLEKNLAIQKRYRDFNVYKVYEDDNRLSKADLAELNGKSKNFWGEAAFSNGNSAPLVFQCLGFGLNFLLMRER